MPYFLKDEPNPCSAADISYHHETVTSGIKLVEYGSNYFQYITTSSFFLD